MYKVIETRSFLTRFEKKIPKQIRNEFRARFLELKENPYIGKPLNFKFLRELKNKKFRVYYLIINQKVIILQCGDKKTQKKDIEEIKNFKYVKEPSALYMKKSELEEQNKLLREQNELLRAVIEGLEDVKAGRYKEI